jgi:hypothetical protein
MRKTFELACNAADTSLAIVENEQKEEQTLNRIVEYFD